MLLNLAKQIISNSTFKFKDKTIVKIICVTIIFIINYFIFDLSNFNVILNNITIIGIFIITTTVISINLMKIRLTFYKIRLQMLLSVNSKLYKALSRGYLIRVLTFFAAFFCSMKILSILCLSNLYVDQYIILYIFTTMLLCFDFNIDNINLFSSLREDISNIIKPYFIPFYILIILMFLFSIYEIFAVDIFKADSIADIFDKSVETINSNYIYPIRVILRHIYALDLAIQQIMQLDQPYGEIIYFLYLMIFDGILTYLCIILLIIPANKIDGDKNG